MSEFLVAIAGFVLLTVVVGLWRILRGPDDVDRTLATQLFGTGGIAVLLLVAAGRKRRPVGGIRRRLAAAAMPAVTIPTGRSAAL